MPKLHRVIAGGILGTGILVSLMYPVGDLMLGKPMDVAVLVAKVLGFHAITGLFVFALTSVLIFPLIYGFLAARMLWGPPWARGVEWGLLLWFFSQLVIVSITADNAMYYRQLGITIFLVSLLGHLLYGGILGAVAGNPQQTPGILTSQR